MIKKLRLRQEEQVYPPDPVLPQNTDTETVTIRIVHALPAEIPDATQKIFLDQKNKFLIAFTLFANEYF